MRFFYFVLERKCWWYRYGYEEYILEWFYWVIEEMCKILFKRIFCFIILFSLVIVKNENNLGIEG